MTEENNKELEKVLASSIQGEIVRTKRIAETTFANLSLIHFCQIILSIELLKKKDQTAEEEIQKC